MARRGPREPWEHRCACGAVFLSACYTAKWCPACRRKRREETKAAYLDRVRGTEEYRARSRESSRRQWEKDPEKARRRCRESHRRRREARPEEVRAYNRACYARNREAVKKRNRLAYHARKGDAGVAMRLLEMLGKMRECPRLHVRAASLPCGQRLECFGKIRCAHCPNEAKPPRVMELGPMAAGW